MGAHNLEAVLGGELTEKQINDWFREHADSDAYEMGHSYSGGWNMMTGVTIRRDAPKFTDRRTAADWILDRAEKWHDALAVKFVDADGKTKWIVAGWAAS